MSVKVLMLITIFTLNLYRPVWAQSETEIIFDEQGPEAVNNKICPVEGEKIGSIEGEKPVTVMHKGRMYNLCDAHCIEDFQKDPEKYARIAEQEHESHEGHDHHDGHSHRH